MKDGWKNYGRRGRILSSKQMNDEGSWLIPIVAVALIFAIVGLALLVHPPAGLQSGTVIGKRHTEPQRIYNPVIFIRSGKLLIQPAKYAYGSDKWQVLVQQRHKTEWWDVSEEFYQNVDIGDRITK